MERTTERRKGYPVAPQGLGSNPFTPGQIQSVLTLTGAEGWHNVDGPDALTLSVPSLYDFSLTEAVTLLTDRS